MATPTVRTVNAQNQNHLVHAASNEAGWRRYLETLSRHTGCANAFYNLSAMNCAGLAASDWHESREILPIATWKSLFPGADIKPADGCTGVYGVKSRPRGSGGGLFYVDELFPPALLVGLPPTMLRGAARVLDLSVDIAAASWSDAKAGLYRIVNVADMDSDVGAAPEAERVPVAWGDLDQNTRFVIEAHFRAQGPGCASPVLPPDDVKGKASSLKMYVNEIVKTAAPLIKQMRNGYRAAFERHRRNVIPESGPDRDNGPDAAIGGAGVKAGDVQESHPDEGGDRPAPVEAKEDRGGPGVDVGNLAREPIERAMRAIGRHSRADGDRVDMETAASLSSETAGDAGTIGRHFARKGETADSPVAGDQVGSRMDGEDADGNGPERHAMRRRRAVEAKPAPEAPPEKYYPHGRPPRETAGHAKSAAARTAKDRGKKKKPPTGKGSS